MSGEQTRRVTRQTETDPDAGGTIINGIAPVIGAPCDNGSGEDGKWESVELVSATSLPQPAVRGRGDRIARPRYS